MIRDVAAPREIDVRPLLRPVPEALSLLDHALGIGYVDERDLREAIEQGSAVIAYASSAVVGLAFGRVPALGPDLVGLTKAEKANRPIGYFSTVAVGQDWRRRGIGTALVARVTSAMRKQGVQLVTVHLWKESPAPAVGIFERLGFRLREVRERFWFDDSKERGYPCPRGHHPCECTALVYVAELGKSS